MSSKNSRIRASLAAAAVSRSFFEKVVGRVENANGVADEILDVLRGNVVTDGDGMIAVLQAALTLARHIVETTQGEYAPYQLVAAVARDLEEVLRLSDARAGGKPH